MLLWNSNHETDLSLKKYWLFLIFRCNWTSCVLSGNPTQNPNHAEEVTPWPQLLLVKTLQEPHLLPRMGLVCHYFQKQASPGAEHLWDLGTQVPQVWPAPRRSKCSYPCFPFSTTNWTQHRPSPPASVSRLDSILQSLKKPPLNYYRNNSFSLTPVLLVTLGRKVSSHLCLWRRNNSRAWHLQ